MSDKTIEQQITEAKRELRNRIPDLPARFAAETERLKTEIAAVKAEMQTGHAIVDIEFADIQSGKISDEVMQRIRRRGVIVVRNVFDPARVANWNTTLKNYVADNDYLTKQAEKAGLDTYFGDLASSKPQIYGVYWSKPQMEARQSEELSDLRGWLNHLWYQPKNGDPEFDPNRECMYADRIRQREPGDSSLGLSPHIDGGSVERWLDPSFHKVYHDVLFGDPDSYEPFNAESRTKTKEIPSPAVCQMFRTYQGWTALTRQGPNDGTLNVVPIARAMAWLLLRALMDDVADDDLCNQKPGHALGVFEEFHSLLMQAYVPIPEVNPGDTVWWHPDIVHGVENEHQGSEDSNVIYIGAAPDCEKNRLFLDTLRPAFEAGKSSPDFAPEDFEIDFKNRFMPEDLNDIGRKQLGYAQVGYEQHD